MASKGIRVLVVDLNNFAMYPSIAIGMLVAVMRKAGYSVDVFAPLSIGVAGVARERPPRVWGAIDQALRYRTAISTNRFVLQLREHLARSVRSRLARQSSKVMHEFERRHTVSEYDIVLVSTYLMYYPLCRSIAAHCKAKNVPLLIGGPYFSPIEVQREWVTIPGLTALVTGEIEHDFPKLIEAIVAGGSLEQFPGVVPANGSSAAAPPPLQHLDRLPFADYTDFPADLYPNTIIPMITGRGCGWGACTFCSDVTSTAGRTYRSRSAEHVLGEIQFQASTHDTNLFVFNDLKLNSNLGIWDQLLTAFPKIVNDPSWIASVHVGVHGENGLDRLRLRQARRAGMKRLTTGLESGSQRILDAMCKGTDLARTSQFLKDASDAGISVRTTMIIGYPGETEGDIRETSRFLRQHNAHINRVSLNRLQLISGTRLHRSVAQRSFENDVVQLTVNHRQAQVDHRTSNMRDRRYRRAVYELLHVVHQINRKPLQHEARVFEGVM